MSDIKGWMVEGHGRITCVCCVSCISHFSLFPFHPRSLPPSFPFFIYTSLPPSIDLPNSLPSSSFLWSFVARFKILLVFFQWRKRNIWGGEGVKSLFPIDLFNAGMKLRNIILITVAGFHIIILHNGYDVMQLHTRIWKGLFPEETGRAQFNLATATYATAAYSAVWFINKLI